MFNIENHELSILHNEGLHRYMVFSNKGQNAYRVNITTWPGYLCISGDMGTYVFSRLPDMLSFFNEDGINPGYWSEKCVSMDKYSKIEEFSIDKFNSNVLTYLKDFIEEDCWNKEDLDKLSNDIVSELDYLALRFGTNEEYAFYNWANEYGFKNKDDDMFEFIDFWDYDCNDYSYGFIWCCYAIKHITKLYYSLVKD